MTLSTDIFGPGRRTAVRCVSKDEAEDLIRAVTKAFPKETDGWDASDTRWCMYAERTTYGFYLDDFEGEVLSFCDDETYIDDGYRVVPVQDVLIACVVEDLDIDAVNAICGLFEEAAK